MRLVLALAAVALVAAPTFANPAPKPTPAAKPAAKATPAAKAPQCRDAKGHYTPCKPATVVVVVGPNDVTKDKNGKCHWKAGPNKGKFVTCP